MTENHTARIVVPSLLSANEIAAWRLIVAEEPRLHSAFYTPTFVQAAASVNASLRVAVIERDGAPVAFLAFQFTGVLSRALGAAQRAGGEMSDYFGLVARPGFRLPPRRLLALCGLHSFHFSHLEQWQTELGLCGEAPETGLRILFPQGGDAFWRDLRARDKKFVGDTERRVRKVEQDHGPLRFTYQVENRREVLQTLLARKREQYLRTGQGDWLAGAARGGLLRALLDADSPDCTGVLSTLYAGDTWAAIHFGLACRGTLHYWIPVYNPALRRYSPGRLLLRTIIDQATGIGLTAIDRGAGDSKAKRDFANGEHTYLRGAWSRPTLAALTWRAWQSLQWRLERLARLAQAPAKDG